MKNSPDLLQSVEHNVREVCKTFGWHYPVKVVATCDLGQIDVQLKFRSDGESDRFWAHINSSIFPEPQCEEWFCAQCVTFFREHIDIKPYHADCGWVSETTKKQLMETTAPRQAHAGLG